MDAREFFNAVSDARRQLESAQRRLDLMRSREGLRGQGYGPRTGGTRANDAMRATDERMDAEGAVLDAMEGHRAAIAQGREMCEGIRRANPHNPSWGDVLELRYCEGMQWRAIATALDISERSAHHYSDYGMAWVDGVGVESALEGMGAAE